MNNDLNEFKSYSLYTTSNRWESDLKNFFVNKMSEQCSFHILIFAGWSELAVGYRVGEYGKIILIRYDSAIKYIEYYQNKWKNWVSLE